MYKVIEDFVDLKDNNHKYRTGDQFPRPGVEVSEERIDELKTDKNRKKRPLIKEVAAKPQKAETKPEEVKADKPKRKKKNAD